MGKGGGEARVNADREKSCVPLGDCYPAQALAHLDSERRSGRLRPHCWNVLQSSTCPLFKPIVSHFCRCAEEPWVKLSGTA